MPREGAVDQDEVVAVFGGEGLKGHGEALEVVIGAGDVDFGPGEIHFGGDEVEPGDGGGLDDAGDGLVVEQNVVDAGAGGFFHAEATGGVGLGVQINQQDLLAALGEAGGQIDGGGGFADSAFLVGDGNDGCGHGRFLAGLNGAL